MSRLISDLLAAEEPLFSISLRQLEELSGRAGADVQLASEINNRVRDKKLELGLGPEADPKAFHRALVKQLVEHNRVLEKLVGVRANDSAPETARKILVTYRQVQIPRQAWVIKKSRAREFLQSLPPPKIMKFLGYSNVEAMLKRENIAEIFGALRFGEGSRWLNQFNRQYARLDQTDFESRPIEVLILPPRWQSLCADFVRAKKHNLTHSKEMGVIVMLPIKANSLAVLTLWDLALLFHYTNEVRLYSAFFKLQQDRPDFGSMVADTLVADPAQAAVVAGHQIHWRVIQRYFGKSSSRDHPEIFQPHVQPEDLHWRAAEAVLYRLAPELSFWQDLDYVGCLDGQRPVSANLLDVAASWSNQAPYNQRSYYHFREALWNEVFSRYFSQAALRTQILDQLDNSLIAPEDLRPSPSDSDTPTREIG